MPGASARLWRCARATSIITDTRHRSDPIRSPGAANVTAAIRIVLLVGLLSSPAVVATERDLAEVEVFVHQEQLADGFRYTYVLDNHGAAGVVSLEIGFDYYSGLAQLSGPHPTEMEAPGLWAALVVTTAESDRFSVAWHPASAGHAAAAGRIESAFVIESPTQRDDLIGSNWTVIFNGGIVAASSRLEPIDHAALEAAQACTAAMPATGADALSAPQSIAGSPEPGGPSTADAALAISCRPWRQRH